MNQLHGIDTISCFNNVYIKKIMYTYTSASYFNQESFHFLKYAFLGIHFKTIEMLPKAIGNRRIAEWVHPHLYIYDANQITDYFVGPLSNSAIQSLHVHKPRMSSDFTTGHWSADIKIIIDDPGPR